MILIELETSEDLTKVELFNRYPGYSKLFEAETVESKRLDLLSSSF